MDTTTERSCPLCQLPIDGFADAMVHPVAHGRCTHMACLEQRSESGFFLEGDVIEHREVLLSSGGTALVKALVVHVQADEYGCVVLVRRKTQTGSLAYGLWPDEILGRRRAGEPCTA